MAHKEKPGDIRVGVGGWTYEPWRGVFYPEDLPQKRELEYASRQFNSIEINGTYYGAQKPASFVRWREETPDDFVFSVKGPRFATNRRVLAEAGDSIRRFFDSGVTELGRKLGPILWQFAATKKFDADDLAAFLALLPRSVQGIELRHAIEVRHESFACEEAAALAREKGVAIVHAADSKYPSLTTITAPFVYLRLMGSRESPKQGYPNAELDLWAERLRSLSQGGSPQGWERQPTADDATPRDVFCYIIAGHKVHNPAAASALLKRLR